MHDGPVMGRYEHFTDQRVAQCGQRPLSLGPMTVCDFANLPISGADRESALGYDRYVAAFLSYGADIRELFTVADARPDAPLINAHAAALHLAFEGAEGWVSAKPYLARMRDARTTVTEREALFCGAVEAWAKKDFQGAFDALDELTVRWPADLCAIKWGQYHAFNLGDQEALLRFGRRAEIAHENRPYAHGMIAFALEQNHQLAEAEEEGLHASEIAIDDAWAHHAVAHVMETQGRPDDGVRWLDHCAHTWEPKGVFIRDHNWWHAALFRLALGRENEAFRIYDERLWGVWPEFPQEQIGAASMLWRFELRGLEVGERWTPVAAEAKKRIGEHYFPFHDLHYLFALARAGEPGDVDAFLSSLQKKSEDSDASVWGEVCLPAAEAIVAFARGHSDDAANRLAPIMPDLYRIGGSHAQRHLFVEILEACAKPDAFKQHA